MTQFKNPLEVGKMMAAKRSGGRHQRRAQLSLDKKDQREIDALLQGRVSVPAIKKRIRRNKQRKK